MGLAPQEIGNEPSGYPGGFSFEERPSRRVAGAAGPRSLLPAFLAGSHTGRRLSALSPFIFLVEFGAEALDLKTR